VTSANDEGEKMTKIVCKTTDPQTGTVEEIMSSPAVTIDMDDSLKVVKEVFDSVQFHHLLVVGEKELVGVLSDRDYLKVISPNVGTVSESSSDLESLKRRAHLIMTRNPITLTPTDTIVDAITLFNSNTISCIPVVDERNRPVGIVSWRDILYNSVSHAA
jgi:acetoin utilization protein AcuB